MRQIFYFSIATLALVSQSFAAPAGSLEAACRSRGADRNICNAYVNGMIAGILSEQMFRDDQRLSLAKCLPNKIEPKQLVDVFLTFAARYPEARYLEAGNVLPEAWKRHFCSK